ncbi:MAG: glycosyltransferase [Elusimicrobiota bacterium]
MPRLLSVVVPVCDEEAVLPLFHARLSAVLEKPPFSSEILFVDDGSTDGSVAAIAAL